LIQGQILDVIKSLQDIRGYLQDKSTGKKTTRVLFSLTG